MQQYYIYLTYDAFLHAFVYSFSFVLHLFKVHGRLGSGRLIDVFIQENSFVRYNHWPKEYLKECNFSYDLVFKYHFKVVWEFFPSRVMA